MIIGKGRTEGISRGEWKQNKGDKKITGDNQIGEEIRVGVGSE